MDRDGRPRAAGVALAVALIAAGRGRRWATPARTSVGLTVMSAAVALTVALRRFVADSAVGLAVIIVPTALYLAGIAQVVRVPSHCR